MSYGKKVNPKISVCIRDIPVFKSLEHAFSEAKKCGADGVEITYGVKCHWPFTSVKALSKKYRLPVLAVHQPLWTGYGFPDFRFAKFAHDLGVKHIVIHPLPKINLKSPKMNQYLQQMALIAKKYKLEMLLENLPISNQAPIVDKLFPGHKDTYDPLNIAKAARQHGFKITLDTSHLGDKNLGKRPWLRKILEDTKNVHLSSFTSSQAHLPLHIGDFDYQSFLSALKKYNYQELITVEVYYPKIFTLRSFDYLSIKKSIELIRKVLS